MAVDKLILSYKDAINAVSPSFCIAKWKQVTLHLQTGHNHSCHHPNTHKIPLAELVSNPSALHNTNFKKEQRKLMLEGKRPSECDYCWRVEDSSDNSISDRIYKSYDKWAQPYLEEIKKFTGNEDVDPSYLEVSFSSVCNFKCSYCSPQISSAWMEEIQQHGAYPTSTQFNSLEWIRSADQMPIAHNQYNPYVDAFWKWWPSVYPALKHFRITGGEPLLTKDTFKALDYMIANPNPTIDFSINSNMCVPDSLLTKFIEKIKVITQEKKVAKFTIFTSADTCGAQAEYIRNGLDYGQWIQNIRRVLTEVPEATFTIMSTYNAMSVPQYLNFLKDVLKIKQDFGARTSSPLILDIPYLRYPEHQAVFILPNEWAAQIKTQLDFMYANLDQGANQRGFFSWEADKFKRIYEMLANKKDNSDTDRMRRDFVAFVDEHDRRRGTEFIKTFPEFEELYKSWK
jgi:organic radical activating enzyme